MPLHWKSNFIQLKFNSLYVLHLQSSSLWRNLSSCNSVYIKTSTSAICRYTSLMSTLQKASLWLESRHAFMLLGSTRISKELIIGRFEVTHLPICDEVVIDAPSLIPCITVFCLNYMTLLMPSVTTVAYNNKHYYSYQGTIFETKKSHKNCIGRLGWPMVGLNPVLLHRSSLFGLFIVCDKGHWHICQVCDETS